MSNDIGDLLHHGQGHSDQKWYAAISNNKMRPHTKFEIASSNNVRDMLMIRILMSQ